MKTRPCNNELARHNGGEVWGWQGLGMRVARGIGINERVAFNASALVQPR
jgi:hypothetical protein